LGLKKKGVLERVGNNQTGYWIINLQTTIDDIGTPIGASIDTPIGTPKSTPTGTPRSTPNITTGERNLLDLIQKDKSIKREKLAELLGISINTVKDFILGLKKKGILERVGNNKTGYWKINYPNN
jgi:ATP-dependent DNA helicase RecG